MRLGAIDIGVFTVQHPTLRLYTVLCADQWVLRAGGQPRGEHGEGVQQSVQHGRAGPWRGDRGGVQQPLHQRRLGTGGGQLEPDQYHLSNFSIEACNPAGEISDEFNDQDSSISRYVGNYY